MKRLDILTAVLLICSTAEANVPASYFACEGLQEGYRCRLTGPFFGRCTEDTLCDDDEETESLQGINECLLCVDECWSREVGSGCIIPHTGKRGVCELIPGCTPDDEKSFLECHRCRDGELPLEQPSAGCVTARTPTNLFLLLLTAITFGGALRTHGRNRTLP